jgi:uncharacterized protein (TIGR04141 family)
VKKQQHETITLTVFLIKKNIGKRECIDPELLGSLRSLDISLKGRVVGTMFIRQIPTHPPKWASFFAKSTESIVELLYSSSVSAVYLTEAAGRIFALTFGHGRHLINAGSYETRFGLRAALNSVDAKFIRAIDASTLEANPFYSKRQAAWRRRTSLGRNS